MTLVTIEGVYENGRVELAERPEGIERSRVMVTFLPDTKVRQPRQGRQGKRSSSQAEIVPAPEDRYPQALRDEYKALIHKKLRHALTEDDAIRLEAVRDEINQRDRQSESWSAWEQRAAEVDREISDLRQELEALPDA